MHYAVEYVRIPETNLSEDHLYSFESKLDRDEFVSANAGSRKISSKEQKKLYRFVNWGARSAKRGLYFTSLVELG